MTPPGSPVPSDTLAQGAGPYGAGRPPSDHAGHGCFPRPQLAETGLSRAEPIGHHLTVAELLHAASSSCRRRQGCCRDEAYSHASCWSASPCGFLRPLIPDAKEPEFEPGAALHPSSAPVRRRQQGIPQVKRVAPAFAVAKPRRAGIFGDCRGVLAEVRISA